MSARSAPRGRPAPGCRCVANRPAPASRFCGRSAGAQGQPFPNRGFRYLSVNHQQLTYRLDRLYAKLPTDGVQEHLAFVPIGIKQPDLDEAVGVQCPIDFSKDRLRQAGTANHHDRLERVGFCAQCLALRG